MREDTGTGHVDLLQRTLKINLIIKVENKFKKKGFIDRNCL